MDEQGKYIIVAGINSAGKTHLNLIDKAHQNGYEVTLLYVAVNSVKTAIKRVNERVESGGHGIPPENDEKALQ
ncbi:hypothetical protein B0W51_10355, partial [Leuconostoc mesenteroides]